MSISVHFHGIVEPDDEFKKKYDAFVACENADIRIPEELWKYFGYDRPNPSGLMIGVETQKVSIGKNTMCYEIDLKSLRKDVSKIQIYME